MEKFRINKDANIKVYINNIDLDIVVDILIDKILDIIAEETSDFDNEDYRPTKKRNR